jgi:histidinol dehydrogenase
MRVQRFNWKEPLKEPLEVAAEIRSWATESLSPIDVRPIEREVREGGDEALLRLTERFDATESRPESLCLWSDDFAGSLGRIDPGLRESLELAAANIRTIAEAQLDTNWHVVELPQGQTVTVEKISVISAGIYAPGGAAAYPSSVLMGCIPARVAGVHLLSLATPPGPDGCIDPLVLAAAELCEVEVIHPIGGAQAVFALAYGTESVRSVNVIAGPGNRWVTEAKRAVYGEVGIDSIAGPSELMVIADSDSDPEWVALDLCAQAEHGGGGLLAIVASDASALETLVVATVRAAEERGVAEAPLAAVLVPGNDFAIDIANAVAPEHVEVLVADLIGEASGIQTAGCVFVGPHSATAFGDYVAGSNHILPTGGAGRFCGPLDPSVFRRATAKVEVPAEAASKLAPHVDRLARAEGFPIHGESAMIRSKP